MNAIRNPLLFAVATAAAAAFLPAQHVIRTANGDQPGANFGRTLQTIADIDSDGTVDLVIGEPLRDSGAFTDVGAGVLWRTGAWVQRARSAGALLNGRLGSAVAGIGDVNGDNVPDWVLGAPNANVAAGVVRVCSGATGLPLYELNGELFSEFGTAVCSIGDRDGDGRGDFAVGSPIDSPQTANGAVRFYSGVNGALLDTLAGASGTGFGRSLATVGDLTGDGSPEIVVGEPLADVGSTNNGRMFVKNPRNGLVNSWVWTASGATANGNLGVASCPLADLDGDGRGDIAVAGSNGVVLVRSGATGAVLATINNAQFGPTPSLTGLADWNGDGTQDLAVGAPSANLANGRVFVYSLGAGNPLLSTIEGSLLASFGAAVADLGDLDGDGRSELAIGAPTASVSGLVVGRVTVHSFDIQPETATFGSGCQGTNGAPTLFFTGTPNLGQTFDIVCSNLRISSIGIWIYGYSATSAGGVPLPVDLSLIGFPGCSLYVSAEASEPYATTNSTQAVRPFTLPPVPSLATAELFVQNAILDPVAAGGLAFSNGGRFRVGNL